MPITPPIQIPNQVLPSGQLPYVQQQNFGQLVGETLDACPDMDPESIKVKLNGIVRKIYDRRTWYGLMIRGQIVTSGYFIGGSVNVTLGSTSVQGIGTSWTPVLIGRQFRIGYNTPPYTIVALDPVAQVLTLEMPWGSPSITSAGYFIAQYYYSPGPNIKYIHTARNLIMAWRLRLDLNQKSLDTIDPWRISTFSPWALAQMPPGVNGEYMVELYPVPSIVQALPFVATVQPPNLVNDSDTLPPYIRTDIISKLSIADAKVYRGPKFNKYYDMVESQRLRGEAEANCNTFPKAEKTFTKGSTDAIRADARVLGSAAGWAINHGVAASANGGWDW